MIEIDVLNQQLNETTIDFVNDRFADREVGVSLRIRIRAPLEDTLFRDARPGKWFTLTLQEVDEDQNAIGSTIEL